MYQSRSVYEERLGFGFVCIRCVLPAILLLVWVDQVGSVSVCMGYFRPVKRHYSFKIFPQF